MASYSHKLLERKYNNWIKAQLAVRFTKEGIEPFVCHEFQEFQLKCLNDICYNNGLLSGTSCSYCCTENVVICPTNRICNVGRGRCNYHRNSATRYNPTGCPYKICHNFKTEIQNAHRFHGPSYKNTDATQWCSNSWEVAKCFMPPYGYKDVDCAQETDFVGIISVIINNNDFQSKVHENLSNKTNMFEKAREIGRTLKHSPTLEVEDQDLQQFFKVFQQLLSDTGYLATDTHAQIAKQKLLHLENDTLIIGNDDIRTALDDAAKAARDTIRIEKDENKKQYEIIRADMIKEKLLQQNKDEIIRAQYIDDAESAAKPIEESFRLTFSENVMMENEDLDEDLRMNWVRGSQGIKYLKEGLEEFVGEKVLQCRDNTLQRIILTLPSGSPLQCNQCTSLNLSPDHLNSTKACNGRTCHQKNPTSCFGSRPVGRRKCPDGICSKFYDEIIDEHVFKDPLWKNTDPSTWCSDPHGWSYAKCFQTIKNPWTSAKDTDAAGLLSIIINNRSIQNFVTSINPTSPFHLALDIRNKLLHSSKLEIDKTTLCSYLDTFIMVLQDPKCLVHTEASKKAVHKLEQLKNNTIHKSRGDKVSLLENRNKALTELDESTAELRKHTTLAICENTGLIFKQKQTVGKRVATISYISSETQGMQDTGISGKNDATSEKDDYISEINNVEKMALKDISEAQNDIESHTSEAISDIRRKTEDALSNIINASTEAISDIQKKASAASRPSISKLPIKGLPSGSRKVSESSIESTPLFNEGTEEDYWELVQGNVKWNKNSLQAACQQYGIHSEVVNTLTKEICHDIQAGSENIVKVWPSYRENDKNDVIFVVETNEHVDSSKEINYDQDFEIVLRQKMETNDEDMLVLKHEFNTKSYIDDEKNKEIKDVIKKYSNTLRKQHSNLIMMCASSLKSFGFPSGKHSMKSEDCIVLYVHIKGYIPLDEDCFPKMLDGFPVDVRETVFQMYGNKKPSDFCQNLKIGCEIGPNHIEVYGTIGGFIEHENHGLCLMTCAHIFLDGEDLRKNHTPLIICNQPSFKEGIGETESKRCGELKFHKMGKVTEGKASVDVAFVKIDTRRRPVKGTFPSMSSEDLMKSGFGKDYIPEYTSGKVYNTDEIMKHKSETFIKYGATTLLTKGNYYCVGAAVNHFGILFENQIKIINKEWKKNSFANKGDSGALVFMESDKGLVAVGILLGGHEYYTIVTPICDILHAVGYSPPYALKTFPDANDNINGNCHIQDNRSDGEPRNVVRKPLKQRQAQVDEVVDNVDTDFEIDQQIFDLDDRAELLQAGSSQCEVSAGKRKFWWKNRKMWLFLLIGIIAVIFVIIIVWHNGGSDSKEASTDTTTVKSTR